MAATQTWRTRLRAARDISWPSKSQEAQDPNETGIRTVHMQLTHGPAAQLDRVVIMHYRNDQTPALLRHIVGAIDPLSHEQAATLLRQLADELEGRHP